MPSTLSISFDLHASRACLYAGESVSMDGEAGFGSPPGWALPPLMVGLVNLETPLSRMHLACASIDS